MHTKLWRPIYDIKRNGLQSMLMRHLHPIMPLLPAQLNLIFRLKIKLDDDHIETVNLKVYKREKYTREEINYGEKINDLKR